ACSYFPLLSLAIGEITSADPIVGGEGERERERGMSVSSKPTPALHGVHGRWEREREGERRGRTEKLRLGQVREGAKRVGRRLRQRVEEGVALLVERRPVREGLANDVGEEVEEALNA